MDYRSLIHTPYDWFVEFFKEHPAIWYVIKKRVDDAGTS